MLENQNGKNKKWFAILKLMRYRLYLILMIKIIIGEKLYAAGYAFNS